VSLYCFFEIYAERQRAIKALFDQARKLFSVDAVHDLRVEIKRLRALFNLIQWINPGFQAKTEMKDIRRLFKAAGRLRDIHVQQELAAAWAGRRRLELSEYLNDLMLREKAGRPVFAKACRRFDPGLFIEKWRNIRSSLSALTPDDIRTKAEERLRSRIDGLVAFRGGTGFTEEEYHRIRILSKETRYTLEIIRKCYPGKRSLQDLDDAIRRMHRALGRWHDDDVGLRYLDAFLLDYEGEALFRRGDYFKLIRALEEEMRELLAGFEKAWEAFLTLAAGHGLLEEEAPADPEGKSVGDDDT
jgi:CHAD domain-containing protein